MKERMWSEEELKLIEKNSEVIESGSLVNICSVIEDQVADYALVGRIVFSVAYLREIKPIAEEKGTEFLLKIGDCEYDYYSMLGVEGSKEEYIRKTISEELGEYSLGLPAEIKNWMMDNLSVVLR